MKAVLKEAILDDKLDKNPISFRAPTVPEKQPDIFESDSKFARFYEAMADDTQRCRTLKNLIYLLSATALRDGDAACLRTSDFDWENRVLRVRNTPEHHTKNYREFCLPITPRLEDVFRLQLKNKMGSPDLLVRESSFLFPNSKGEPYVDSDGKARHVSKYFREQRNRILPSRPDLHPHSIRHSVAQHADNHGVSIRDIMAMLNHSGQGITERFYARPRARHRNEQQYGSFEEYLMSLPVLTKPTATPGEPQPVMREPVQGLLTISEVDECSISEVSV